MKQAASARPPDSPPLVLYASPWSAPAWMKTNGELIGEGQLLPEHYQLWADYLVRFLDEYSALGVDFWGKFIDPPFLINRNLHQQPRGFKGNVTSHVTKIIV